MIETLNDITNDDFFVFDNPEIGRGFMWQRSIYTKHLDDYKGYPEFLECRAVNFPGIGRLSLWLQHFETVQRRISPRNVKIGQTLIHAYDRDYRYEVLEIGTRYVTVRLKQDLLSRLEAFDKMIWPQLVLE